MHIRCRPAQVSSRLSEDEPSCPVSRLLGVSCCSTLVNCLLPAEPLGIVMISYEVEFDPKASSRIEKPPYSTHWDKSETRGVQRKAECPQHLCGIMSVLGDTRGTFTGKRVKTLLPEETSERHMALGQPGRRVSLLTTVFSRAFFPGLKLRPRKTCVYSGLPDADSPGGRVCAWVGTKHPSHNGPGGFHPHNTGVGQSKARISPGPEWILWHNVSRNASCSVPRTCTRGPFGTRTLVVYAIISPLCNTALEMVVLQPVPGRCNLGSQGATGTRVPGTNSDYIPWMVCSLKQS